MGLKARLQARIRAAGPIGVDAFMTACLHDPEFGYYATRPRLGEAGDFITAPLVSQMFGELIGLWAVETWVGLGRPAAFRLVEVGPGDGTLFADMLRAARLEPAFLAAADLWLVETSAPLAALQRERLAGAPVRWAAALDEVPGEAPMILVANEVLDCLPVVQFVRRAEGWAERVVGLDADGELAFALAPPLTAPPGDAAPLDAAPLGTLVEVSAAQRAFVAAIARRIARFGGAALLIDYGGEPSGGDTLQALKAHRKVDPLATAGEADLTVHADFRAVLAAARAEGARAALLTQGEFLRRLGVEQRAAALSRARPDRAGTIARQLARLTDTAQMGRLFKAACLFAEGEPAPPAFEFAEKDA
ncbi:MAG: SAM-dependent methyltransferase [Caulobacteraceae bacterium]|nr:SAM-dependent methyltransferase [Caulobacteraceae bacterium]